MFDFVKTGDPAAETYGGPGMPCVACTCNDALLCDNYKYVATTGASYAIQSTNWRHPGTGTEVY